MAAPTQVIFTSDISGDPLCNVCARDLNTSSVLMTYKCGSSAKGTLSAITNEYLISADENKPLIHIWATSRREPILRIPCPGLVSALDISSNGSFCVAAIEEKIYIWRLSTGQLKAILSSHWSKITCIKFSPSGLYFVSGDEHGLVAVWSLSSVLSQDSSSGRDPLMKFSQHTAKINDIWIGFGRFSTTVATASEDGSVKLLDLGTGDLLRNLVFDDPVRSVTLDNVENLLFAGLKDGNIGMVLLDEPEIPSKADYTTEKSSPSRVLCGHSASVSCLSMSWDGKLASGSADGSVKLWNVASRTCMKTIAQKGPVTNCAIHLMANQWQEQEKRANEIASFKFLIEENKRQNVVVRLHNSQPIENRKRKYDSRHTESPTNNDQSSSGDIEQELLEAKTKNRQLYKFMVDKILESR